MYLDPALQVICIMYICLAHNHKTLFWCKCDEGLQLSITVCLQQHLGRKPTYNLCL